MSDQSPAGAPSLYVYAIVPADRFKGALADPGLEAVPVTPVGYGPVAALVSRTAQSRVRPSRANLTAHQRVVDAAHRTSPVLPVRFGTILPDEATVRSELLEPDLDRFAALLERMEDKDEYRLKVSYVEDAVLEEVVRASPPIQRARAELRRRNGRGSRDGMIVLGEMVRAELERVRETDSSAILEAVQPHVVDYERLAERADAVALHAALLVRRDDSERLEEAVEEMARRQGDRVQVELLGPLPPWDFTEISAAAL